MGEPARNKWTKVGPATYVFALTVHIFGLVALAMAALCGLSLEDLPDDDIRSDDEDDDDVVRAAPKRMEDFRKALGKRKKKQNV